MDNKTDTGYIEYITILLYAYKRIVPVHSYLMVCVRAAIDARFKIKIRDASMS